jgi:hypothetical protein
MDETRKERCDAFWEHLTERHPLEENYSKATKLAYRWPEPGEHRFVVVQYVSPGIAPVTTHLHH